MKITIADAEKRLNERRNRSAWDRGVALYAFDLLDNLNDAITDNNRDPESRTEAEEWMLNGARDWGNSAIADLLLSMMQILPSDFVHRRN